MSSTFMARAPSLALISRLLALAWIMGEVARAQGTTPERPNMPAYPSPFHVEALEGLEAHPDHPAGRADTEGRIRLKALSGIARMQLIYPASEKPVAVEIRIDGWGEALEGLDLERPDGDHRSLIETGEATIGIREGTLTITLRPAALAWLEPGTRFQFIDRYR